MDKKSITTEEFLSLIDTERKDGGDICHFISRWLSDNNYRSDFEDGFVERLFKSLYDNNLLSRCELRYFFIILHERFKPYDFLKDDYISIIQSLNPPILDRFAELENKWVNNLPGILTIYRGLNSEYVDLLHPGVCWSTKQCKALSFCRQRGMLLTATCKKSDCLCFFQGTDEYEVVLPEDKIQILRVDRIYNYKNKVVNTNSSILEAQ